MPPDTPARQPFADRLLDWWQCHGRHDLPWQVERTPYRVWVAEIMLQQTQVTTVIGYFERFMARFPDLAGLARADLDEVLALWSGLGYYARARNLHAAARICLADHDGRLPASAEALQALPGIGRSTAHAILAQAFDRRAPILDGNVRRVLARHAGIAGWPGRAAVSRRLWKEAERRTPAERAADYSQAIMDLGATVCTPRNPGCDLCPIAADCVARRQDRIHELPGRRPTRSRRRRPVRFALMENEKRQILLVRRPPSGVWGGLWCLPSPESVCRRAVVDNLAPNSRMEHALTHLVMDIEVYHLPATDAIPIQDSGDHCWAEPAAALALGLPRPVRKIVEELTGAEP